MSSARRVPRLPRLRAAALALVAIVAAACTSARPPLAAQRDHMFPSGDAQLHGRLHTPAGRGPYPTVLYVAGSGDYSLLTDAYALNTVRAFVDRGMAVFVFDKRGIGQSGGREAPYDLIGKTGDVRAALDFLAERREVDHARVIVWAISQAGWFAPQAIAGRAEVRGLILVSPAGDNPLDHSGRTARREFAAAEVAGADFDQAVALWRTLWRYQGDAQNYETIRASLEGAQQEPWFATVRATRSWQGLPPTADALMPPAALQRAWAEKPDDFKWLREQANYADYAPVYRAIRRPVLVIYGAADTLIDPMASRRAFESAFRESGLGDVTITSYENAGHGIQARGDPEHPMAAYLAQVTDWALLRFSR